ncbi:MAG: DUF5696 domain-containing protein [Ruminococcus sp.]|nr:DUF5696 domain-containing protein [Ruminococcus sp.]MCM1478064.1 DUF5696 domain-containing protein [Muribaculaceae bacterium]
MRKKMKKLLACLCCMAMLVPVCAFSASSEDEAADTSSSDEGAVDMEDFEMDDDEPLLTDEQVMAEMKLAAENDKLALYYNDKDIRLALVDKNTGEIWWSNPINADASAGKAAQKQELKSGMTLIFGEPSKRRTTTNQSSARSEQKMTVSGNTITVEYDFANTAEIMVPVTYTLNDDCLSLHVDTKEIVERNGDKITVEMAFNSTFGAADMEEEGYFVIPDGSGAIINFNNGKSGYRTYQGKVYGADITAVKTTKPAVTQGVYLPMYGIVKGNSGLMVVADKGDTCATINAYTAGQNKTSYNACYFDFEVRTSDEYLMGGDSNPLKVFEKRGILVPEIEIKYYPVSKADQSEIDYVDIANAYKNHLKSQGVTKSDTVDSSALYVDFYGATIKTETVLGMPVKMQHKTTSFSDAQDILSQLKGLGVENMVVNYNQWTTADIKEKVADKAKPASLLGGKSDFNSLMNYANSNGITIYPEVDNLTFKSGGGYFTMTDTTIRVSNAYSRQIEYDLAHGIENKFYKSMSLLSPRKYEKMFSNLAKSYSKAGIDNISLGSATTVIYGDYGKNSVSREMFKYNLQGYMENLKGSVGSVLADGANAYMLPYVDHITNIPLNSSKFDAFDRDIPFYQIVMSGLKPVSTTAVNGDAQIADLVLKAVACGSNLRFDLVAEDANELKDTRYDVLYYADYKYWLEDAAGCYKFANEVLKDVAGAEITEYNILPNGEIETVYSNGVKTTVNLDEKTVTKNGAKYSIYDYVGEEVIG